MNNDQWFKQKGQFIQQMRKKRFPNDTQSMFAARIGVGLTTIQNLEAGKEGVAWGTVVRALEILGFENGLDNLFSGPDHEVVIKAGEDW
jgi:DNA-binding XRE family transcriptional regulator